MPIDKTIKNMKWLRKEIIGKNKLYNTPFGERPLVFADYTASGRAVKFIEDYMIYLLQYYANTHTEDDFTGKTMTTIFHKAEKRIKNHVNAGKNGKIIFTGSGATGAITRLQQILGLYWAPVTENRIMKFLDSCKQRGQDPGCNQMLLEYINSNQPVVFLGPYEHHSNEIMWRHNLCDTVETPLNKQGYLDLEALEKIVSDPKYDGREKIGSFSAASNVSGIKTPVYEVAKILHRHNTIACFDFAACAPYVEINMNKDDESYFDAIMLSPHKFLGGPGSSGLLIFNENIYNKDLPPTISAGGTVDYVSYSTETFIDDIETREKPGTPGILQGIKAALAFDLKAKIGVNNIEKLETYYLEEFYKEFKNNENITFYGPIDTDKKINIIPFNIKHKDRILHPKFVTKLMSDLFGIQTRAGCSCAGPYGHRLLNIEESESLKYNTYITDRKYTGIKPGWVRLNIHYSFSKEEYKYIVNSLYFLIKNAHLFLEKYEFCMQSGDWTHIDEIKPIPVELNIDAMMKQIPTVNIGRECINFDKFINKAYKFAEDLKPIPEFKTFDKQLEDLMFFYVKHVKYQS